MNVINKLISNLRKNVTIVAIAIAIAIATLIFMLTRKNTNETVSEIGYDSDGRVGLIWDKDAYGKGSFKAQRNKLDRYGKWLEGTQEDRAINGKDNSVEKEFFGNDQWVIKPKSGENN